MTHSQPTDVTVIVPTRDRPELVRATIASIISQDYDGMVTVLVVFDQSEPDQSLASDDSRRPVVLTTNARTPGLAGGRNTGLQAAETPYVAFCDDDDTWHPTKLTRQVAELEKDDDVALVATGITVHYGETDVDRLLDQDEVSFEDLLRSRLTELHPSTFLMRRKPVVEVGMVDEVIPGSYAEDYEFLLRIAKNYRIRNVREPLVDVLWHKKSFFASRWETIATALRWLLDRYPEFDDVPVGKARITGQIAFAEAASGNRSRALKEVRTTIRLRPTEARAYLALLVSSGAVTPDRVLSTLHRFGRGI